jgi:hypothetical protein
MGRKQGGIRLLLLLLLFAVGGPLRAQQSGACSLSIPEFEGRIDRTVSVPVYLTNAQEVVAAQFDVELPFAMPKDGLPTLSNRATQHSVTLNAKGGKKFSVVIMSMQNKALRGNSGLLLRLPMQAYDDGHTDQPYPVRLTNIVLTDRQGNDIASSKTATGYFTVSRADQPDLIVSSVTPVTTQAQPGEPFVCDYVVKNDGTGNTHAGWSEKIYLESVSTQERTYIGTQYYADSLIAGMTVSRKFYAVLPTLVHVDGELRVVVEVVPTEQTGELLAYRGNNTGVSSEVVNLGKKLFVSINKQNVSEGWIYSRWSSYRDAITLTVSRSGDWSNEESFPLTCSVNGLLMAGSAILSNTTTQWVTIKEHAASATVQIYAVDDQIVRAREANLFVGESNGYNGATLHITRTDNDTDPLTLTASLSQMTEGKNKQLTLTATRGGEMAEELVMNVSCSQPMRFAESNIQITIPKLKSTGSVILTLVDDDIPQPDVDVQFSVWPTDYQSASAKVRLNDDDRPTITMTLNPSIVSENAGSQATTAIIHRDRGIDKPVELTVRLSSSSESNVYFAAPSVLFKQGDVDKEVIVGVIDNSAVDGQRQYKLTASLYLPTVGTTAASTDRATTSAQLTVIDDESPYLTLSAPVSIVGEGSSFTATVRRYVASTASPLTVNLSVSKSTDATVPESVTIPSGQTTATFKVTVNRNQDQTDNNRLFFINAQANGLMPAQLGLHITDRTLPDAACATPGYDGSELYSGMEVTLSPEIMNIGTATLPADMQVEFFLASSDRLYSYTRTIPVFTASTNDEIGIGESRKFTFSGKMPAVVGTYWLYARLNGDGKLSEYSTANNLSTSPVRVTIAAPFSVTELKVEKESYLPGQTVKVTGVVATKHPDGLQNQYVSVTLDGRGQNGSAYVCKVGQDGKFEAYPTISASASGYLTVKGRAQGQTEADMTTSINVWNMTLTADKTTWTLDEGYPHNGKFVLRNTSGKTITGLTISHSALPFGCGLSELKLNKTTLAPGEDTEVTYRVDPTKSMTGSQYASLSVTASCAEGVTVELPIRYYCRATNCQLVFDANTLRQTLLLNSKRKIEVKVTNRGLKESGKIAFTAPEGLDWFINQMSDTLASIGPGRSAYIVIDLKHQPGMHSGNTFSAYLSLNPENGATAGSRLDVTVVGTEYSKLHVNASDIFVKARREYRNVSAVQVAITDARTGKTVMTGLTDGAGYWMTDRITQGTYYVTLSALRHKSVRQLLVLGPGDEQRMSFFLPYQAVLTDFVASQDVTDGTYHLYSNIDVDSMAPQAIVLPTLPENGFECGSDTFNIVLHNAGQFTATDVQLVFPSMSNATFSVGDIPTIGPGNDVVVPVSYKGPESGRRKMIAKILMHYGFTIGGEQFSEDDYYQSLVGCVSGDRNDPPVYVPEPPQPDGGDVTPGSGDDGNDDDDHYGETKNDADTEGPSTDVALPTYNSSIKLIFEQLKHVSVGEPFYAELKVVNGQNAAMSNIRFTHMVSDDSDDYETDMTTFFSCQQTEVTGFTQQSGQTTLRGNSEGTIRLAFTPTQRVTADGKHVYYLGGLFGYYDNDKKLTNTVVLPQVTLTVTQKGEASVVYLLQNEMLGNTEIDGEAKTAVPGQMLMFVTNKGQAAVSNLRVMSTEPSVVINSNNEPARLKTLHSSANGQLINDQLSSLHLDTLAAGQTTIARWVMQSADDCHLTDADSLSASVESSADGELDFTVEGVHKLFRAVRDMNRAEAVAVDDEASDQDLLIADLAAADVFLLDDEEDEERLPDQVLLSDGSQTDLQILDAVQAEPTGRAGEYTVTVKTENAGWFYLRMADPTNGMMTFDAAARGQVTLSRANAWTTNHTVLSDYQAVGENMLHLADSIPAGETTYVVTFKDNPEAPINVMRCRMYTANDREVSIGDTINQRVTRVQIEFTRDIRQLYKTHIFAYAAGRRLVSDSIDVIQHSASLWTIDFSRVEPIPGLHHIDIAVDKLKEPAPSRRTGGQPVSLEWTEDFTATAFVKINVATGSETGKVNKKSDNYEYGMLDLVATPANGYQFDYWMADDVNLGTNDTLHYQVEGPVILQAHFSKCYYEVTIKSADDSMGMVGGAATGYYEWQKILTMTAIPNEGYEFVEWKCDNTSVTTQTIEVVVTANCTYTAVFKEMNTQIVDVSSRNGTSSSLYNVNGQLLRRNVTNLKEALRSLPEGLYLFNGQKVLNRK